MTTFLTLSRTLPNAILRWLGVLLVCLLASTTSWAQGLGIAAVINDDVISMLDLNARVTMIMQNSDIPNTPEARARIAPQVLRGLIDEKLKLL